MSRSRFGCETAGFLLALVFLGASATAAAEPRGGQPWRFIYERRPDVPVNCPDEQYIRAALDVKLGTRAPFDNDASRAITVVLVRAPQQLEAQIEVTDVDGKIVERHTVHADSWRCDQLADRAVFALRDIVAPLELPHVEAETSPGPLTPTAATTPSPPPPQPAPSQSATPATAPAASRIRPKLAISASIGPAWWNTPETALTVALGADLRWSRGILGIQASYDHAWVLPGLRGVQADRPGIAALACLHHGFGSQRFSLRACALGELAWLVFDADKIKLSDSTATVTDLGARLGAGWWFARGAGFEIHADGVFVMPERPFVQLDEAQAWRMPAFTAALRFGFVGLLDVL